MDIISIEFFIFLVILTFLYYLVPKRIQWITILLANLFFYAYVGIKYIIYILLISGITFWVALQLEKLVENGAKLAVSAETPEAKKSIKADILKKKKLFCGIAIVITMGVWAVLKYGNCFIDNINILSKSVE